MGTVLYKLRSLDTTTTAFKCRNSMKATKNENWIRNCILKISQFISAKEIFFVEGAGGGQGVDEGEVLTETFISLRKVVKSFVEKVKSFCSV